MQNIVIIGASGFGKEVAYHIKSVNEPKPTYNIAGFIDDNPDMLGKEIIYGLRVIGNITDLANGNFDVSCACIAIANNPIRKAVYDRLKDLPIRFPNIIHGDKKYGDSNVFGSGNIFGDELSFT